jgi:glyoxylase-like metal-dependent hydrolase (beta-lactamase superfamily II)
MIRGDQYILVCDTHLGPISMNVVKEYISSKAIKNEVIIFNSHSDWDHIWGNCAFPNAKIIAHETARTRLQEIGEFELSHLKEFHNGEIELILPNLTFNDKLTLANENIEFIYAPGHTIDSSICFDQRDSFLFIGDLVEYPIPYLDYFDLEAFIKTLEFIKNFPAKIKLSAHSGVVNNELINRNIHYVEGIFKGKPIDSNLIESSSDVHQYNLNNRLLLQYEPLIRERLGNNFDYASYKSNFGDLGKICTNNFKSALKEYISI